MDGEDEKRRFGEGRGNAIQWFRKMLAFSSRFFVVLSGRVTQDVGLCGTASALHLPRGCPFRTVAHPPAPGSVGGEEEGKEGGTMLTVPGRNLLSPTDSGVLASSGFPFPSLLSVP